MHEQQRIKISDGREKIELPAPTDPPRDGSEEAQNANASQRGDLNTKYLISALYSIVGITFL